MSNRRGSVSDYPEHLNPFYEGNEKLRFWKFGKIKRSGSFGESLRNTLSFKSFRGKKKDKQETPSSPPELRKYASTTTQRQRQTLPTTLSPIYSPARNSPMPPLPRSRFSERVGKLNTEDEVPNGRVPSTTALAASQAANPFDEDENVSELKPKRIRRRKRRAPLPPNMVREEGDNSCLGVSSMHNFSKWSLTSVETDVSYSESDHLPLDLVNPEISEMMNNITKEMEKMTDDTNNNNSIETKDVSEDKQHSDIPDLIASSTEGVIKDQLNMSTEKVSVSALSEHDIENPIDENSNLVSKLNCENDEEIKKTISCDENENTSQRSECDSNKSEEPNSDVLYNASYTHAASVQDLNFNERKSIFITASNDQLDQSNSLTNIVNALSNVDINQNENVSPPASPRCKTEVNVILNNVPQPDMEKEEVENEEQTDTKDVSKPIPKTRTHKPSKGDLLGNEVTEDV